MRKPNESKINLFALLNVKLTNTKDFFFLGRGGGQWWPASVQPSISEQIDLHNLDSCFQISSRSPQHTSYSFLYTSFSRHDGRGNIHLILERIKAELNCQQIGFISRQPLWSKGPKCNWFTNDNLPSTPAKFKSLWFAPKAVPPEPSPDMKTQVQVSIAVFSLLQYHRLALVAHGAGEMQWEHCGGGLRSSPAEEHEDLTFNWNWSLLWRFCFLFPERFPLDLGFESPELNNYNQPQTVFLSLSVSQN